MTKLLLFIFLLFAQTIIAQKTDSLFGKPIFWYRVSDPWAMFMGAEGPIFILYDSGKVLFWKNGSYKFTELSSQEKNDLINELGLHGILFESTKYINATNADPNGLIIATDNPSYTVFLNFDTLIRFSVYGYISSKEYRKHFPDKFLFIHNFITQFDDDNAIEWIPEKVEVLLSDYTNSQDILIEWPKGWPDLNSIGTRKPEGFATSIFLNKQYFKKLIKLIRKRREKQAFAINGNKYFIGYRFPIPGLY